MSGQGHSARPRQLEVTQLLSSRYQVSGVALAPKCADAPRIDARRRRNGAYRGQMQDFRRLLVWQRAHAFVLDTHRAIDAMPRTGHAELKAQLRRASESIANNIVEGCAAAS